MKDIHDRTIPENYVPSAKNDECRYCKYGFIFKGFKDDPKEPSWSCGRTSGNFRNLGDDYSCGYFERLEPTTWRPIDGEIIFRKGLFYKITADNDGNWCGDFLANSDAHRDFKNYVILDDMHNVIGKVNDENF